MVGYYFVKRGLFRHHLFTSSQPYSEREAWLWLIEHANFSDGTFRHKMATYLVPRGSLATSYRALAEQWRWSPNRVIRVLNLFKSDGMIDVATEHGFVLLTRL